MGHVNAIALAQTRAEVVRLKLEGMPQYKIAERLGIAQSCITAHLKKVQKIWRAEMLRDFDELKAIELAKIDHLEAEYWVAWHASRGKHTRRTTSTTQKPKLNAEGQPAGFEQSEAQASIVEEEMNGDPRYLEGVRWCIAKRCEILGLNAPTEIDLRARIIRLPTPMASMEEWAAAYGDAINVKYKVVPVDAQKTEQSAAHSNGNGHMNGNGNGHAPVAIEFHDDDEDEDE